MQDSRRYYRENDLLTASQKKLVVSLYESCMRHIQEAEQLLAKAKILPSGQLQIKTHQHFDLAQEILNELMLTINFDEGGIIAANLYQLYRYFHQQLSQARIKKDPQIAENVRLQLSTLCEAWNSLKETQDYKKRKPTVGHLNLRG